MPDPSSHSVEAEARELFVWGANCVWWDSIDKAATKSSGLPCCPHCGSVLFEIDPDKWWANVDAHEAKGNPGYRKQIEWMRGRCFRTMAKADEAYKREGPS